VTGPPEPEEITDAATLKALMHPLRRRILATLGRDGPATATTLAKALGQNSGATSYHLRELAKHGFIDEATELAHGKERWWRMRPRDIRWPRHSKQSDEMRSVFGQLQQRAFADDLEHLARFLQRRDSIGEWSDAFAFSRGATHMSIPEFHQFWEDYMALLRRYVRPESDSTPDMRRVLLRLMAFPDLDEPDLDER
jgi:DNA-binding transcriptional ArsR family regulator